ncbi:MAG: hypothetical protein IJG63_07165, partial [Oscillospiraceae bacterium]|nr:hypothetical protein [Oscillospiraceae bacterium]
MNGKYEISFKVPISMCDYRGRLSYADAASIFLNMASEDAESRGLGVSAMPVMNFFWLTLRARYRFHRMPACLEEITVRTWIGRMKSALCNRYYTITKGDELLVEGKTEWAVFDTVAGRLASPVAEEFKTQAYLDETVCDGAKYRVSKDFGADSLLGKYMVSSADIDIGMHMNNVAYLRAVLSLFTTEQLSALDIREIDVNYHTPSLEGDELSIYKRD